VSFDEKLSIAIQMCDALAAVHAAGVVHRDLKPDNVFLVPVDGERLLVKLLDFGIAKLAAGEGAAPTLTQNGITFGTPAYVSPEQAQGAGISARSDVYGLGVVLYEMFLGRPPFQAESDTRLMQMHVAEAPVAPRELWPDVPPGLERLLLRMLDKEPEKRPHVVEVRQDLQELRRATAAASSPPLDELHARVREVLDESTAKVRGALRHRRVIAVALLALAAAFVAWALLVREHVAPPLATPAAPVVAAPAPAPAPTPPPPAPAPAPAPVPVEKIPAAVVAPAKRPPPRPRRPASPPVDERTLVDPFAPSQRGR
jgi:serine/threonine-protein kinase